MRVSLLLVLMLSVVPALGAGDDPTARHVRDLTSPFSGTRDRAQALLAGAGPEVEARLLAVYPTSDFVTQAALLDVLAERRAAAALPVVLADLENESKTVREAQARLLAALGDPARQALHRLVAGPDRAAASRARELLPLVVRVRVERTLLARTIGQAIHYRGQYAHLLPDREYAIPVLHEMIRHGAGGYRFHSPVWHVVDIFEIRAFAVEVLGDIGGPAEAVPLLAVHAQVEASRAEADYAGNWRLEIRLQSLARTMAYALWDLGEKKPAETLAKELFDRLWLSRGRPWEWERELNMQRYDLAATLLRMKRFARAEEIYLDLLAHAGSEGVVPGLCAYNLACVQSLDGRVEDALSSLLEAARNDPWTAEAAGEDGDLQPVRDRYPDLVERLLEVAPEPVDPDGETPGESEDEAPAEVPEDD